MGCGSTKPASNEALNWVKKKYIRVLHFLELVDKSDKIASYFSKGLAHYVSTMNSDDFINHVGINDTAFSRKLFTMCDMDGSDLMDFPELLFTLWNLCTLDDQGLVSICFDLYDANEDGVLEPKELKSLVEDSYGVDLMSTDNVQNLIKSALKRGALDRPAFLEFTRRSPEILKSVVDIQLHIRKTFLGERFWDKVSLSRQKKLDPMYVPRNWRDLYYKIILLKDDKRVAPKVVEETVVEEEEEEEVMEQVEVDYNTQKNDLKIETLEKTQHEINRRIGKGENEAVIINKKNRRIGGKESAVKKHQTAKVQPMDEQQTETATISEMAPVSFGASPDFNELIARGGDELTRPSQDIENEGNEQNKSHVKYKDGRKSKKANYKTYGIIYEGEAVKDETESSSSSSSSSSQPQQDLQQQQPLKDNTKNEETNDEAKLRRKAEAEARAARNKKSLHVDEDINGVTRKKTTYKTN
jgi:Ca2+-binding EF-hand superfamily protein